MDKDICYRPGLCLGNKSENFLKPFLSEHLRCKMPKFSFVEFVDFYSGVLKYNFCFAIAGN